MHSYMLRTSSFPFFDIGKLIDTLFSFLSNQLHIQININFISGHINNFFFFFFLSVFSVACTFKASLPLVFGIL